MMAHTTGAKDRSDTAIGLFETTLPPPMLGSDGEGNREGRRGMCA